MTSHNLIAPSAITRILALLFLLFTTTQAAHAAPKKSFAEELDALGANFSEYMNQQDFVAVLNLFDTQQLASSVSDQLELTGKFRKDFETGMLQSLNSPQWLRNFLQQDTPTFISKGARKIDGKYRAIVRIDYETGGHNFLELLCKRNQAGELKIVDFFIATTGQNVVATLVDTSALLLKQQSGVVAKLLAAYQGEENLQQKIKQINELRSQGKFAEAHDILQSLPDSVRDSEIIVSMSIMLSSNISDELYRADLNRLAKLYGDKPRFSFMLIDHYFYEEDFTNALKATGIMQKRYGTDAALLNLQGRLLHLDGKGKKGNKALEAAIKAEPYTIDAYWSLMEFYAADKQFQLAVDTMSRMENQFDYTFSIEDFDTSDPTMASLVNSDAFKQKVGTP